MKRRLSKTCVLCLATVMFGGFYLGSSAYVSDLGMKGLIDVGKSYKNGFEKTDELYEIINNAAQSPKIIDEDESQDLVGTGITKEEVSAMVDKIEEDQQKRIQSGNLTVGQVNSFDKVGIVLTDKYVNVYEEASSDSDVVGKMFNGAFASIVNDSDGWIQIISGNVNGYIASDYIITGKEAQDVYEEYVKMYATINSDGELNVREEGSKDADPVAKVVDGEKYEVLEKEEEWVKIKIGEKTEGYVSIDYVDISTQFAMAISNSEEQEMLEAEKKAILRAEAAAKRDSYSGSTISFSDDEFAMFVALIFSEAGNQPYEGKVAVGQVIINRIKSSKWPNTLKDVVYQPSQFGPARDGSLNKNLSRYNNGGFQSKGHKETIQAAKDAMNGKDVIGSRMFFNTSTKATSNVVKIGSHYFW